MNKKGDIEITKMIVITILVTLAFVLFIIMKKSSSNLGTLIKGLFGFG